MSLTSRRIGRILLSFFFRGLLLLAPVTIMRFLDGIIPLDIPGLGLLTLLAIITVVGWLGTTFLYEPLATFGEELLQRIPFLKTLYDAVKDLVEAIVGSKRKFDRPVLVKLGGNTEVERLGFITQNDLSHLGLGPEKVAVYLPHAFNWSGNLYIVPARNVTPLDARAADVMKFVVSGGVSQVDEEA
jgi:uncharacterized membrane protein